MAEWRRTPQGLEATTRLVHERLQLCAVLNAKFLGRVISANIHPLVVKLDARDALALLVGSKAERGSGVWEAEV